MKRKPARHPVVAVTDANNNVILEKHLYDLPVNEDVVIQKSIEFFNDPEPCYIHRGAVLNRLYAEIEHRLAQGPVSSGDEIVRVLVLPYDAAAISMKNT
jgi:hypothetical protein